MKYVNYIHSCYWDIATFFMQLTVGKMKSSCLVSSFVFNLSQSSQQLNRFSKSSLQQLYNRHSKLIVLYLFPITYIGFFDLVQAISYRNCLSFPGTLAYRGLSGARVAHLFSFQCCELCFVLFEYFAQYLMRLL
jgi:hypothetical protein